GDQKLKEKGYREQHWGLVMNLATPHRRHPVEDLDTSGNGDGHGGEHEESVCVGAHADGEHVVGPHAHGDECNTDSCSDHCRVSENPLPGKAGGALEHK